MKITITIEHPKFDGMTEDQVIDYVMCAPEEVLDGATWSFESSDKLCGQSPVALEEM